MIYYFDASAFVKAFCYERGSKMVIDILNSGFSVYSSIILYPEVLFALRRKKERKEIEEAEFQNQIIKFENRWESLNIMDISLFWLLKDRVIKYPLKAIDAIHLASALWIKENLTSDLRFVCSDKELLEFSMEEGFNVINPEENDSAINK